MMHNTPPNSPGYDNLEDEIKCLRKQLLDKDTEIATLKERLDALDTTTRSNEGDDEGSETDNEFYPTRQTVRVNLIYQGNGQDTSRSPMNGDVITMHYRISLKSDDDNNRGTTRLIEDSRERRDSPYSFVLGKGEVIEGLESAVKQMHKGDVAEVAIPYDVAYGGDGFGGCVIPPNQDLVCKIELIDFQKNDFPFRPWIISE